MLTYFFREAESEALDSRKRGLTYFFRFAESEALDSPWESEHFNVNDYDYDYLLVFI